MDVLLIAGACYRPVQEQAVAVCSCIYAFAVIVSSKLGLHARECFSLGKDDSVCYSDILPENSSKYLAVVEVNEPDRRFADQ